MRLYPSTPPLMLLAPIALVGALASGAAGATGPLPRPDLSSAEPSVRAQVEAGWQRVVELSVPASLERSSEGPLQPAEGIEVGTLADAVGTLGRLYHSYRFEQAAAGTYAHAQALDPADPVWPYLRAVILQRDRRLEEAESALRRVLELAPRQVPARLRLAEILRLAGRDAEAEALWRALLDPTSAGTLETGVEATARYGLGRVLASRGDLEGALGELGAALRKAPGANVIRQRLGLVHRRLGNLEQARAELGSAGPVEPTFSDPWARDLLPTGATARLLMGNRFFRRGQVEAALYHHRAAHAAAPDNPAVLRALAVTLERLASDPALGAETESSQPAARRSEALDLYARARQLSPDDPLLHFDFARAHLSLRAGADPAPALAALRRAVDLAPSYGEAHLLLAAETARAGSLDEASSRFETVLRLSPGHPGAKEGLTLVLLGLAAREAQARRVEKDRAERALVHLERLLELEAEHLEARRLLARTALELGREGRAARAYEGVLATPGLDPSLEIETALGLARVRALAADPAVRDPARALELARRAFGLAATPEGAEVMALALASAGGFEQAVSWQTRLLEQARAGGAPPDYLERLEGDLGRYRSGQPARRPWPAGARSAAESGLR